MAALKELLEAGKLTPVIDRTYPLSEVREAMRYLQSGQARSKDHHHPISAGSPAAEAPALAAFSKARAMGTYVGGTHRESACSAPDGASETAPGWKPARRLSIHGAKG